jgi:DNA end-binding protein Ku
MAARANWKGYLRLSLVSCPIALYPASSEREKISFHQINSKTGNRVKMSRVDAVTGEPVEWDDIVKGYEVGKGQYIDIKDEELEAITIESSRTIEIDEFVPREEIDDLYNVRPYFIAPEGKIGADAFAVIRETINSMNKVALGRVVLTSREHVIALEPRGKGLVGTLLRYPYEVRDPKDYFEDIPDVHITKDMLDLARHIVESKSGHFEPQKFEDRYESALRDLLARKQAGQQIEPAREIPAPSVVNLMDALRASLDAEKKKPAAPSVRARKPAEKPATKRKSR